MGLINQLTETTDLEAQTIALQLNGIPASAVQQVLTECRPSYVANIYIGAASLEYRRTD